MSFPRIFLNRQDDVAGTGTIVVIDVLRSFTTAAVALARGARAVYAVEGIDAALALGRRLEAAVTVGAVRGGDPVPEFDFGNCPAQLAEADLACAAVVLCTAAGVRGLQRFAAAPRLYAASLVCARATADALRAAGADDVGFVITGEWVDRDGDEDLACADYIEALLCNEAVAAEAFERRVRDSDFGRRFAAGTWPSLPPADLALAAHADRFDFAMRVRREGEYLVIRREPPAG